MKTSFKKSSDELQIVWAEVYAPDVLDSDNDYMSAETIREAAYNFLKNGLTNMVDVNHDNEVNYSCYVVESFIARPNDPDFIEGAWVAGVHIDNTVIWNKVKSGELNGFSLEAKSFGVKKELEVDFPDNISGVTHKEDDHEHEFVVNYDSKGNFLGGETNVVNGHKHIIKRGTVSEVSNGHRHKFSYVEGLTNG